MKKKLKIITIIIDLIMLIICLVIDLFFLYYIFNIKYSSIPKENMFAVITASIIIFVIPWILLSLSFILGLCRTNSIRKQVIGLISGAVIIPYSIVMILSGFFLTFGAIESKTQSINNYNRFDSEVNRQIKESAFLFPESLPEDVYNEKYHYKYVSTLDDEVQIYAAWTFEEKREYENEKQRILNEFSMIDTKTSGNMVYYYTSLSNQYINLFVYNDETKEVHYLYLSFFENEEMQDFEILIDEYIMD